MLGTVHRDLFGVNKSPTRLVLHDLNKIQCLNMHLRADALTTVPMQMRLTNFIASN